MSAETEEVKRKAQRLERDRKRRPILWKQLAHVGVLGWVFILPVIALAWGGHALAQRMGQLWPSVIGLGSGIALGAYLVWRNLRESLRDDDG